MMKICIVGLGYVGLPLAVGFGKIFNVTGFDIDGQRIKELKNGIDRSGELTPDEIKAAKVTFTSDQGHISKSDFIIITVPTPITKDRRPDLTNLKSASRIVGENLKKGSIVVYESTVYPGVTEEICVPVLEKHSKMRCGKDFKVGYSPERINPGDRDHSLDKVVKVVSGMDQDTLERVADAYSKIISAGVFRAPSIKVAEAAKVIENIQRDLNIALMNELSLIFERIGISTKDVLDAAGTKWNFHRYSPGLVGGHCIGVDPYYLTFKAQQLGYEPQIILAGRHINEYMSRHVAEFVIKGLSNHGKALNNARVLILGLTFKENVRDYRNSKALDLINELKRYNLNMLACDPLLENSIIEDEFGVPSISLEELEDDIDCVVILAPHDEFRKLTLKRLRSLMKDSPILVDIRSFYSRMDALALDFRYFSL